MDQTEGFSMHTSVAQHSDNRVVRVTQIEHQEVWDFRICSYTFVAGKSTKINVFKNSSGEVLRPTMDYLRPYGKTVTVEEANRMIKEFQAVAVAVATEAGGAARS